MYSGELRKCELADIYNMKATRFRTLLNETYFEELQSVGYKKTDKTLSPNVINKFIEIHGKPISQDNFIDKFNSGSNEL